MLYAEFVLKIFVLKFPTNPSMNIPPAKRFLLMLCVKLVLVCAYGDLVNTDPSGSSTIINPPCPLTVMFLRIVASFIKKQSMSLLFLAVLAEFV